MTYHLSWQSIIFMHIAKIFCLFLPEGFLNLWRPVLPGTVHRHIRPCNVHDQHLPGQESTHPDKMAKLSVKVKILSYNLCRQLPDYMRLKKTSQLDYEIK